MLGYKCLMTFYDNLDENDKLTSGSVGFTLRTLTQRSLITLA